MNGDDNALSEARQFLDRVGLPPPDADIGELLTVVAGDGYVETLNEVIDQRADGDLGDVLYPLLFRTADIAVATASLAAPLTEQVLAWLIRNFEPSGRVVELGCGAGIISCFVADRHPDREVIGVDSCAEAVTAATTIAARLGLNNVTFRQASILDPPHERYDDVIGVTVAAEIDQTIHQPPDRHRFSTIERIRGVFNEPSTPVAAAVTRWATGNASLYSVERCAGPAAIAAWWAALERAGWVVDRDATTALIFGPEEHEQCVPAFKANRGEPNPMVNDEVIIDWWLQHAPHNETFNAELELREYQPFTTDRTWLLGFGGGEYETYQLFVSDESAILWMARTDGYRQILHTYDHPDEEDVAEARDVLYGYVNEDGNPTLVDSVGILADPDNACASPTV